MFSIDVKAPTCESRQTQRPKALMVRFETGTCRPSELENMNNVTTSRRLSLLFFIYHLLIFVHVISGLVLVNLTFANKQAEQWKMGWLKLGVQCGNWTSCVCTMCAGHRWNYHGAAEFEFVSIVKHKGFLNRIFLHFKKEALWNVQCDLI